MKYLLKFIFSLLIIFQLNLNYHLLAKSSDTVIPKTKSDLFKESFNFIDTNNNKINPINILQIGQDIYCLTPRQLYLTKFNSNQSNLILAPAINYNDKNSLSVAKLIQELTQFCYSPTEKSLYILDKSSAIFKYNTTSKTFILVRPNSWQYGEPDPQFIDITYCNNGIELLDPERNQLWLLKSKNIIPQFKECLPWRMKPGAINVSKYMCICQNYGITSKNSLYHIIYANHRLVFQYLNSKIPKNIIPTRMNLIDNNLYICYQQNCLLVKINLKKFQTQFLQFDNSHDLRSVVSIDNKIYLLDGNQLKLISGESYSNKINPKILTAINIPQLNLPIKYSNLPNHPGCYPGARRIYRHGIHKGIDFFVYGNRSNLFAYSCAKGELIRVDSNFIEPKTNYRNYVLSKCSSNLRTSEEEEDLLRGRQIWIKHSANLVSKYAHLDSILYNIKPNTQVQPNQKLAIIGSSGTSEGLAKNKVHEHLHFEIWFNNNYLGYGLTEAETIALYQRLFNYNKNFY